MGNKKNILICGLVIAIVAMSIGYAALAQQLTVTTSSYISDVNWKIELTNATLDNTLSKGVTEISKPTIVGMTVAFDIQLASPGAQAVYKMKVKNEGTMNAYLKAITKANDTDSSIKYTITGVRELNTLNADQEVEVTITIEWVGNSTNTNQTSPKAITEMLYLDYEQSES